ncbi:MAG: (Fe-S)-binding protein [Planctomycetota bacterium]|nr:MAG: (Fe-S)-binding protein [Planctomycetota bacterium]
MQAVVYAPARRRGALRTRQSSTLSRDRASHARRRRDMRGGSTVAGDSRRQPLKRDFATIRPSLLHARERSAMSGLLMTLLLAIGLGVFAWTMRRRWLLMHAAKAPAARSDNMKARIGDVLKYMFGQARMFRYRHAGVAHAYIFGGFCVLALRTLTLIARGYAGGPGSSFGFWLFDDDAPLGIVYLLLKDVVTVLVIVGVVYFLWQRLVVRPTRMTLSAEGVFILGMILALMLADLTYEAAGRLITDGGATFHWNTPAASAWALVLSALPTSGVANLHVIGFWLHTVIVLAFLNVLPYGKHFHVLTVLFNVLYRDRRGIGRLNTIDDIEGRLEREETLGVRTVEQFSWKSVLDFYTCTECGRCSDHCPAFNTGKLLSPKHLTIALRDHMYGRQDALIRASRRPAGSNGDGAYAPLVPDPIDPEVLWACTTCGACEQECPVFITYIDKIVDMRRNLVMEQGEFPDQLQNAFRGLETVGNPYSFANEQRAEWADGLDVPLRSEKPDAEYLYWVGCAPSFDDRSRKIARALAQLLKHADVDFAILGPEETCTGDPARRAGNEYLFQMFAQQNVETLNGYNVRKIITTCPHCYNTLKNEYPDFGGAYEVIHHTELLADLVRSGRLAPRRPVRKTIAYHDSCYIGRYNDIYDPPREVLRAIPELTVVEAAESRDRGMCCGAGGAQMWKEDEPIRRPGSREGDGKVNHARTNQLLRVLPDGDGAGVATACPFCKTMITDGMNDKGHEHVVTQDVAEVLWESVRDE